jgi:hypothetical protein
MPLSFTPLLRLMRCHACDKWHSSRVVAPLTSLHCKLRPNTEGPQYGESNSFGAGAAHGLFGGDYTDEELSEDRSDCSDYDEDY